MRSLKESLDLLDLDSRLLLDEEGKAELAAEIHTVEAQLASPRPKKELLRPILESVLGIVEVAANTMSLEGLSSSVEVLANRLR